MAKTWDTRAATRWRIARRVSGRGRRCGVAAQQRPLRAPPPPPHTHTPHTSHLHTPRWRHGGQRNTQLLEVCCRREEHHSGAPPVPRPYGRRARRPTRGPCLTDTLRNRPVVPASTYPVPQGRRANAGITGVQQLLQQPTAAVAAQWRIARPAVDGAPGAPGSPGSPGSPGWHCPGACAAPSALVDRTRTAVLFPCPQRPTRPPTWPCRTQTTCALGFCV